MPSKTYTGKAIDVSFDDEVCIHAGECVRNLPAVFDTRRRPWILPDAASVAAIRDVVALCPSGALQIVERAAAPLPGTVPAASAAPAPTPTPCIDVTVRDGGPFVITGAVRILAADGTLLREAPKISLCRCGRSNSQPFCDGSHKKPAS